MHREAPTRVYLQFLKSFLTPSRRRMTDDWRRASGPKVKDVMSGLGCGIPRDTDNFCIHDLQLSVHCVKDTSAVYQRP